MPACRYKSCDPDRPGWVFSGPLELVEAHEREVHNAPLRPKQTAKNLGKMTKRPPTSEAEKYQAEQCRDAIRRKSQGKNARGTGVTPKYVNGILVMQKKR